MKKIIFLSLLLMIVVSIWYLFIKQYDYEINFEAKTSPGTVYHKILKWNSWDFDVKHSNIQVLDKIPFQEITQKVTLEDVELILHWKLTSTNEAITKIKLGITSGDQKIKNRLALLTGATDFTKSITQKAITFREHLTMFLSLFKIEIEGKSIVPVREYVYVTSKCIRSSKANAMIKANADLYPKLSNLMAKEKGYPFIEVTRWDKKNDSIVFNFGFPVKTVDTLPIGARLAGSKSIPALKATFHGNYSLSDTAWFALLNYAEQHSIEIETNPLEIFYDNPMGGGDDRKWKAEIYLPIKTK